MGDLDEEAYWILDYYGHRNLDAIALADHARRGLQLVLDEHKRNGTGLSEFRDQPFLSNEIENGFRLLSGQLAIALRANLETFCEDCNRRVAPMLMSLVRRGRELS